MACINFNFIQILSIKNKSSFMSIKKISLFIILFFLSTNSSYAILEVTKLPYKDAEIEKIYKEDLIYEIIISN